LSRPASCSWERRSAALRGRAPGRAARPSRARRAPARRWRPEAEALEDRTAPTTFTLTSPVSRGELPAGVTAVGGIVLDLIGANGRRVVSQLPARALFSGIFDDGSPAAFRGNPGTIGVQTGFTPETLGLLGGGLSEAAVRLTVFDGDTAPGNFDFHDNELLLNGVPLGDFSDQLTQKTSQDGLTALSAPGLGFRNAALHTGFFYTAAPDVLAALFASLGATGAATFQLRDADPFDNLFDFTLGVDGGLVDVGTAPVVVNLPPVISAIAIAGPATEGGAVSVTVTAADPDASAQPLTYDFDFDDDGVFETSGSAPSAVHTFAGAGTHVITVRVRDQDGGEAVATASVRVERPRPSEPEPPSSPAPADQTLTATPILPTTTSNVPAIPSDEAAPVVSVRPDAAAVPGAPPLVPFISRAGAAFQAEPEPAVQAPPPGPEAPHESWFSGEWLTSLEAWLRPRPPPQPQQPPPVPVNEVDPQAPTAPPRPDSDAPSPAPPPGSQTASPQVAATGPTPAVRVMVLLIPAVWLAARRSAMPSSRLSAQRRRLGKAMAAFNRGPGG
jgi:hypothetical protein